ncbi:MAG TPA: hypothetical protein VI432_00640, partial [Candidatus Paceibacterota bacterium]
MYYLILSISAVIALALVLIFLNILFKKKIFFWRITRSLNMKLISITLPVSRLDDAQKEKEAISLMEQFYSSLSSIRSYKFGYFAPKPYIILELAVSHIGEEISFYLSAPEKIMDSIEKQ